MSDKQNLPDACDIRDEILDILNIPEANISEEQFHAVREAVEGYVMPELLETLDEAQRYCPPHVQDQCRAAIAKARGQS